MRIDAQKEYISPEVATQPPCNPNISRFLVHSGIYATDITKIARGNYYYALICVW